MAIYSFLTKEFRGGIVWEFSLASYDQFFLDRGLFGDDPPQTLDELLEQRFLSPEEAAAVGADIAEALHAAENRFCRKHSSSSG